MPPDPLGPRKIYSVVVNYVAGGLLIVIGLYGGIRHGGWAWAALVIGISTVALTAAVLYLDPFGRPRRGMRGAVSDLRDRLARRRAWRSRRGSA